MEIQVTSGENLSQFGNKMAEINHFRREQSIFVASNMKNLQFYRELQEWIFASKIVTFAVLR